jgi:hypothetical protein
MGRSSLILFSLEKFSMFSLFQFLFSGFHDISNSVLRADDRILLNKNSIRLFCPMPPPFISEINLHISDYCRECRIMGILSTFCILMIFLIINIIIRSNTYIAHPITIIKKSFIIQTSMFSILSPYVYNVEYTIRICLEEILAPFYNPVNRYSSMQIGNQSWGWMI